MHKLEKLYCKCAFICLDGDNIIFNYGIYIKLKFLLLLRFIVLNNINLMICCSG